MNFRKIWYTFLILILVSVFFFLVEIFTRTSIVEVKKTPPPDQIVFEAVPLTSQKDFKMIGQKIYVGSGYEPGFNFAISLAGTKFGTDLTSQYGDTHYVGYLDLSSQSSSTKVFSGNMLDKNNKIVAGEFIIFDKKCFKASGDEVPYSVSIKVGTGKSEENLKGCAELGK